MRAAAAGTVRRLGSLVRGPVRPAWVTAWATLAVTVATGGAMLSGCTEQAPPFPVVPSTLALRPSTSAAPREQLSRVAIAPLEGTAPTSTIGFGAGEVVITGLVSGPDGPVPGASVRIERFVGEQRAVTIVGTDAEGRYRLADVTGGQIRVQAFRPPDLAQETSVVAFASGVLTQDLVVTAVAGPRVQWAIAPAQPLVDRGTNLVIQVSSQQVDAEGLIRTGPRAGIGVTLVPLGAMQNEVAESRVTDTDGRVSFPMVCRTTGSSSVRVVLATGEESLVEPLPCVPPPTVPPPTVPPPNGPNVDGQNPSSEPGAGGQPVPVPAATTVP